MKVSLSGLRARNKTLTAPGGGEPGGICQCVHGTLGADTGPGAEVDLLAHAPRNWWLGSRERERGYWVLKTG